MLLATLGAGFIGPPHLTWGWAEIITVFCAVCFAVHILLTQRYTMRMDPLALTFTSFVTVAVMAMALALLTTKTGSGAADLVGVLRVEGVLVPLRCLGLLGSLVALGILNLYQRHLEPVRAAIITPWNRFGHAVWPHARLGRVDAVDPCWWRTARRWQPDG